MKRVVPTEMALIPTAQSPTTASNRKDDFFLGCWLPGAAVAVPMDSTARCFCAFFRASLMRLIVAVDRLVGQSLEVFDGAPGIPEVDLV